jgi:hypothetical protein
MTFVFAPCIAMTAVYSDGTHQIERIVVGFAAEGPQVLDPREGKTIMNCTDPAAAARPGMKFLHLIARVVEPYPPDMSAGEDFDGELDESLPDVPPASG